jgi:hypothetical protein
MLWTFYCIYIQNWMRRLNNLVVVKHSSSHRRVTGQDDMLSTERWFVCICFITLSFTIKVIVLKPLSMLLIQIASVFSLSYSIGVAKSGEFQKNITIRNFQQRLASYLVISFVFWLSRTAMVASVSIRDEPTSVNMCLHFNGRNYIFFLWTLNTTLSL